MDMDVKAGYTYTYTVKAYRRYNGKNYYSSYDKKGKSGKLTTVVNYTPYTNPGEVYWKKTTGATGYYIYRAAEKNGKYSRVANITDLRVLYYRDTQLDGSCYYKVTPYATVNGKNIICTSSAAVKVSYYKDNPNVVDREAPLDKLPTRKTVQVCARQTGQLGWDFSLPKYTEDYSITVTSSNPSVATVVVCSYKDYFTYNGKPVYQKGYMLKRKGYGKTTITVNVKLGGKTYKKSCEYNYVKHKNPFSSLKIGSKNYVGYANKECEIILSKISSGKLSYKLKQGYKIEEIRVVYKSGENQSKFKVLKNGENVPSGTNFIEFRVSDMFGTSADIVLSTYKYQS